MSIFPTYERMQKPDYEQIGKSRHRSKTLKSLRSKVSDEVIADANFWLKNWEFAVNGYYEALENTRASEIPGDALTFNAMRGKALRILNDFKRFAGHKKHFLLVQLLGHGWSFTSIGAANWPSLSENRARNKAAEQCIIVLEELHNFLVSKRKKEVKQIFEITHLYNKGYNLPNLGKNFKLSNNMVRNILSKGEKILKQPKHSLTAIGE